MSAPIDEEPMIKGNQPNNTGHYNPGQLLDFLIQKMDLPNDGALAKELKVAKSVIEQIRNGELPVGGSILLWMHEATGIHVDELRSLMGDRRTASRLTYPLKHSR
jgi:hypothetical protein